LKRQGRAAAEAGMCTAVAAAAPRIDSIDSQGYCAVIDYHMPDWPHADTSLATHAHLQRRVIQNKVQRPLPSQLYGLRPIPAASQDITQQQQQQQQHVRLTWRLDWCKVQGRKR
jgi:hypothetical protein